MSRNVCFFWNTTYLDRVELSASAAAEGWPVSNLQNPQIARAWKCPDAGGWVQGAFDIPRMVTALVLVGHNLGLGSKVRLTTYDDNFQTEVYRQEAEVIKPVYTMAELALCNSSMFGYPTEDDLAILPRTNFVMLLDKSQCRRSFRVDIDSPAPFHVGRLLLCEHFEPVDNVSYGWTDNMVDDSSLQRSLGGQNYVDSRSKRYGFSFSLDHLKHGEVYGPLKKMFYHCGIGVPLVVSMLPEDRQAGQYTSIHCTLTAVPRVTKSSFSKYSAKFDIVEAL